MNEARGDDTAARRPNASDATLLLQEFLKLGDRFESRLGRELRVNTTDYRAMEHLLRAGPLTASDLARRVGVSAAALTTVVDRLAKQGHVRREPDETDRRRVRVVPAPESAAEAEDILLPMIAALDDEFARFGPSQQQTITEYLRGIVAALRAHADATDEEKPRS